MAIIDQLKKHAGFRRILPLLRRGRTILQMPDRLLRYPFVRQKRKERELREAAKIPESSGGRYYEKAPLKIGILCDRFFYDSFYSCCDLVYLSPDCWQEQIDGLRLFLLVTTWGGLHNNEWFKVCDPASPQGQLAVRILEACKARGIPTVFYSKEDPVNYDRFIWQAKLCDFVFTTARESIPDYVRDCGHERVFCLGFSINPAYHNPVGMRKEPLSGVVFSGAWRKKYPERCAELKILLDGVRRAGKELLIIDREFTDNYGSFTVFPKTYYGSIVKAVDHKTLQRIHKLFAWAININTVKQSETMFANRVYELQANGNLLLSNESAGVKKQFPTVFIVRREADAERALNTFTDDEIWERRISGVRRVMTGETCFDRMESLCRRIGTDYRATVRRVLVVGLSEAPCLRQMFDAQSLENKVFVPLSALDEETYSSCDLIAFFSEKCWYGPFYLEDMVNTFKYTDCSYVTKPSGSGPDGREHRRTTAHGGRARSVYWRQDYTLEQIREIDRLRELPNGYAADGLNFSDRPDPPPRFVFPGDLQTEDVPLGLVSEWELYGTLFTGLRTADGFDRRTFRLIAGADTGRRTVCMAEYLSSLYSNVICIKKES